MQMYYTNDQTMVLTQVSEIRNGVWLNLMNPTPGELDFVSNSLNIPLDLLKAPLDEEERARIETEDGITLILIDIPVRSENIHEGMYVTIPMGIILSEQNIITICLKENPIIKDFTESKVKSFFTYKKSRFLFQILYRNASYYLQYLRDINRNSNKIETELHKSMKNKELIQLMDLEKSLVYFSTSLKSNEIVLERILRLRPFKMYEEDEELLEDVIIENKQAIEMVTIYSDILSGTMDAFASIISNNLNIVMKFLASITIVLSVPTMVASFFGMNVVVPMSDHPQAFLIIFLFSFAFAIVLGFIMYRKDMF